MCFTEIQTNDINYSVTDYPPRIESVCGDDYIGLRICLNCGQTQGNFPKQISFDADTNTLEVTG
jgi:hypothetical protein